VLVLQDKDCRETTFLDYMSTACCMIYVVKRSTYMKVCIFVRVKRRCDSESAEGTSLVHNALLEEVIFQEIYRPTCYRLQVVCLPSVWLMSEEIDINKYILLLLYLHSSYAIPAHRVEKCQVR